MNTDMNTLLQKLKVMLPSVIFEPGDAFFWSPEHSRVTYRPSPSDDIEQSWALLHEAAHAVLDHRSYEIDLELLLLEVAAWEKAKNLAREFDLEIDEDHVQDCLDTYRDWLHQRATCPRCSTVSLQASARAYQCHNCSAEWSVSTSRFCRPYRRSNAQIKKSPEALPQATFQ